MRQNEKQKALEALLYVWGDPLPIEELASVLNITPLEAHQLVQETAASYAAENRGLVIRTVGNAVQMMTDPEVAPYLERLFGQEKEKNLSHSALETLALIAYKQPITRIAVDEIRGVKSTHAIETLLRRGLIEEAGRLEQVGRPILYRTTDKFLRAFALESLDQLPSRAQVEAELQEQENAD